MGCNQEPAVTESVSRDSSGSDVDKLSTAAAKPCLVVAVGASAGGQEPLEHLFLAMPHDCGAAYIVAMHLPPQGPSFLPDILSRFTPMKVVSVEETIALAPNTVYVLPPGFDLILRGGFLHLEEFQSPTRHCRIDRLFASIAADARMRGVGVILSGSGADGARGASEIREQGGIVIVQNPDSAATPSMPRAAIEAGACDFVLPPEEIAAKIAELAVGACTLSSGECHTKTLEEELAAIFAVVKEKTGHDFSSYKINTVMRRIERRMSVNDVRGVAKYIDLLQKSPLEAEALSQDILIGVTSFFRDPEAFAVLENEVIPSLLAGRDPDDPVRVWHASCATGEEVYSTAILFQEYLKTHGSTARVQLFATDIDEAATAHARLGTYTDEVVATLGEERLKTFFTRSNGRWRVSKELREMVVFAHHSLIKDPPFSRLDLLVCRNFLIYLNADMQRRLIPLFHQVLKPGGFLFLGAAETVGRNSDLFTPIDKRWKIYQRLEAVTGQAVTFPFSAPSRMLPRREREPRQTEPGEATPASVAEKILLERFGPSCVLVNEKYEVIHIATAADPFLKVPVGEPTRDILKMSREELRPSLRAAVYKAFTDGKEVEFRGIRCSLPELGETAVNLTVIPLPGEEKLAMVVLQAAPAPAVLALSAAAEGAYDEVSKDMLIRQLEEQLRLTHEQLQVTTEQLETSNEGFLSTNEELMSINEEFQSTNEELQSTNEELETSKEELQALNEELVTVNAELQGKVEELNQATTDMENLLTSSEIATLFLDRNLTIKRFTPAMGQIFNLIPADAGRPFRHLAGTLEWTDLAADAEAVLENLSVIEREVSSAEGDRHFLMRVLPYRTGECRIDGIVVTLIDITARKTAEEATQRGKALLRAVLEQMPSGVTVRDARTGKLILSNVRSGEIFGELVDSPDQFVRYCGVHPDGRPYRADEWPFSRSMATGEVVRGEEVDCERDDGARITLSISSAPVRDKHGEIIAGVGVFDDITERKRAEEEIRRYVEELHTRNEELSRFNTVSVGREMRMVELKKEVNDLCEKRGEPRRYRLEFVERGEESIEWKGQDGN